MGSNYTQAEVKDLVVSDLWKYAQPWLIPSVIIMLVTYGVIRFIELMLPKNKKLPREVKALIPILICIGYQFFNNRTVDVSSAFTFAGIGFAHGAVISTFYEMFVWRLKKKIHGE
jgi:hypothetical protein